MRRAAGLFAAAFLAGLSAGCANFDLTDCADAGDGVLGADDVRVRSWRVRMKLQDVAAVAARFADHAAMASYAYVVDPRCGLDQKLNREEVDLLERELANAGWVLMHDPAYAPPPCETDLGLFFHVWKKESGDTIQVALAFRGTWGWKDWWYGNLYWFRWPWTSQHQYSQAQDYARRVIAWFEANAPEHKRLQFETVGHSLGGGLAQGVLYKFPDRIQQAYAFNPSSATSYVEAQVPAGAPCVTCRVPQGETRIHRIYESREILANLRIFHKLFFPTEPWITEVRVPFGKTWNPVDQHAMLPLASMLLSRKLPAPSEPPRDRRWYAGVGAKDGRSCTEIYEQSQKAACDATAGGPLACDGRR